MPPSLKRFTSSLKRRRSSTNLTCHRSMIAKNPTQWAPLSKALERPFGRSYHSSNRSTSLGGLTSGYRVYMTLRKTTQPALTSSRPPMASEAFRGGLSFVGHGGTGPGRSDQ